MDTKEKNMIEIVNQDITSFACELGYSYLNAGYSKWENGKGEVLKLDSMKDDYLENCISFIERGIDELEDETMDAYIKKSVISFARARDYEGILKYKRLKATEEVVESIKESLIEVLEEKKKEVESYL